MQPPIDAGSREPRFGTVAIVGVGLIGGSLGLALKAAGACREVVGADAGPLERAVELGAVDRALPLADAAAAADVLVLSTPVGAFPDLARAIQPKLAPGAVVTDTGSVKRYVLEQVAPVFGSRFVGAHPIAGKERSGVEAATGGLFTGAHCIVTPAAGSDPDAVAAVEDLWRLAGGRVTTMPPEVHDEVFACVSHLPHVVAFALMTAVDRIRPGGIDPAEFAAGGLRDFTRVAGGDPVMWRDICLTNPDAVIAMIDAFAEDLDGMKDAIRRGDGEFLLNAFAAARRVRRRVAP
jgi:prephenate dehydrogenase